jgi:hypothetical protein
VKDMSETEKVLAILAVFVVGAWVVINLWFWLSFRV